MKNLKRLQSEQSCSMTNEQKQLITLGRQFGKTSGSFTALVYSLGIIENRKLLEKFYSSPVGELLK